MRNAIKSKAAGWMGGGFVLAVIAAIVVPNLQGTDAQPKEVTLWSTDTTHATTTSFSSAVAVPSASTPFDQSNPSDDRPATNSRASSATNNPPDVLYAALYSVNPEERLTALDSIWQSASVVLFAPCSLFHHKITLRDQRR